MTVRARWRKWWRMCRITRRYIHGDPFIDLEHARLADALFGNDPLYSEAMTALWQRSKRPWLSLEPELRLVLRRVKKQARQTLDEERAEAIFSEWLRDAGTG